jgi:hypothetical protein
MAASPDRVLLDRLRARVDLLRESSPDVDLRLSLGEMRAVVHLLTPIVETAEALRMHQPNGPLFFMQLEGALVAAHDRGLVNETAVLEVLRELLQRQPLTLDRLVRIFGVQAVHDVTRPEFGQVERLAQRLAELVMPRLAAGLAHSAISGGQS